MATNLFHPELEKALADFLYLNKRGEVEGMVSEFKLGSLNRRRVISCAGRMKVKFSALIRLK